MDLLQQLKSNFNKMSENVQKVYDAGVKEGSSHSTAYEEISKRIQNNGARTNYQYAYVYMDLSKIKILYDFIPVGTTLQCFAYTSGKIDLAQYLEDNNINFDTSGSTSLQLLFEDSEIVRVPVINAKKCTGSMTIMRMFNGCKYLETVDELVVPNTGVQFSSVFGANNSLKNIKISGVIGGTGFDISSSKVLTRDSILSILQACNLIDTSLVVTLSKYCIDGLTDTLTTIQNDTELNTAYTNALANGYTITFK